MSFRARSTVDTAPAAGTLDGPEPVPTGPGPAPAGLKSLPAVPGPAAPAPGVCAGFSVNATALEGLAQSLDRRERDLESGRGHLHRYTRLDYGPGLLNEISGGHQRLVAEVDRFLRAARGPAAGYAVRIRRARASYRATDTSAAARYDARLPARPAPAGPAAALVPGPAAESGAGPGIFADAVSPSANYRPPPDYHDRFPYRPQWADALSPASLARDAVWAVTGVAARLGLLARPVDPYEAIVAPLCGDWAGLYRCGAVMDCLAAALDDCDRALHGATATSARVWTGRAAAGCAAGLHRFGAELAGAAGALRNIGAMYRDVAGGVYANAELLGSVITLVIDQAVAAQAAIGSGGALVPVTVISEVRDVASTVDRAVRLIARVQEIVRAGNLALDSAAGRFGVINPSLRLPAISGDYPVLPAPMVLRRE